MTNRQALIAWVALALSSIVCRSAQQQPSPTAPADVAPANTPQGQPPPAGFSFARSGGGAHRDENNYYKVGFWTKADSVTYFDDLAVTSLDGTG